VLVIRAAAIDLNKINAAATTGRGSPVANIFGLCAVGLVQPPLGHATDASKHAEQTRGDIEGLKRSLSTNRGLQRFTGEAIRRPDRLLVVVNVESAVDTIALDAVIGSGSGDTADRMLKFLGQTELDSLSASFGTMLGISHESCKAMVLDLKDHVAGTRIARWILEGVK
jgi:hypothetical protein